MFDTKMLVLKVVSTRNIFGLLLDDSEVVINYFLKKKIIQSPQNVLPLHHLLILWSECLLLPMLCVINN